MMPVEQLIYPIADALSLDMDLKDGLLYGEAEIDLDLVDGIPITTKIRVVDSVVDDTCGTVGVLMNLGGYLYLAMINDDRCKKLTFFVVDGQKAGITLKLHNGTARVGKMDKWDGWSRKKFYAAIASGVKATFTRPSVADDWETHSVGPKSALDYLASRGQETDSQTADDLNAKFKKDRLNALAGSKK